MNRVIKFRAWDESRKIMIDVDVLAINPVGWYSDGTGVSLAYQPNIEVMQFTGLHDKNGVEIYEGDVIRANDGEERVICYDIHQAKYKAVPQYAYQHNAGEGGWTGYDLRNDKRHEIIGNIYENHDLLEVPSC